MGLHSKLGAGSQPMVKFLVESEALPIYGLRPHQTAFEHMMNAESKFCDAHPERFTIYTRQRVFGVRTEAFGDVILVPSRALQSTGQGGWGFAHAWRWLSHPLRDGHFPRRWESYWMLDAEVAVGGEWAEWYRLTPAQRWNESRKLWQQYLAMGGKFDPEPDTQSPFYFPEASGTVPADGRTSVRSVRRR